MRIVLFDRNWDMVDKWNRHVETYNNSFPLPYFSQDDISTRLCLVSQVDTDAIVSPANSFGAMDGGIDLAYLNEYGKGLADKLQQKIKDECEFEQLPVGTAVSVEIDGSAAYQPRYLIAAPTMITPRAISDADVIWQATAAALFEAWRLGVGSVAIPGMGTGTGGISKTVAANRMINAIAYWKRKTDAQWNG